MIKDKQADVFVFPEVFVGLYDNAGRTYLEDLDRLIDLAREKDALLVCLVREGSSITKSKDDRFITALLVSRDGILGESRKRNPVPGIETSSYSCGYDYGIIETPYGKAGISICYDANYGTIGKLKQNGAEIIFAPFNDSGFSTVFHNVHRYYTVINGAEYRIPVAVANKDGISQLIDENGMVISPWGRKVLLFGIIPQNRLKAFI